MSSYNVAEATQRGLYRRRSYQADFPERPFGASTNRGWEVTLKATGLDEKPVEFWKDKKILDVGSGFKSSRSKLENVFPGATMVALDLNYKIGDETAFPDADYNANYLLQQMAKDTAYERRIGAVQHIPARFAEFDVTVSTMAVPLHLDPSERGVMWAELTRVTKPGGEIRLWPDSLNRHSPFQFRIIELLLQAGYSFDLGKNNLEQSSETKIKPIYSIVKVPDGDIQTARKRWFKFRASLQADGLLKGYDPEHSKYPLHRK